MVSERGTEYRGRLESDQEGGGKRAPRWSEKKIQHELVVNAEVSGKGKTSWVGFIEGRP